jgi:tape measure domain-containing protein
MKFDNAQFEKGVATTMSTLDKLKASLNFKSIATGLENITSTFKSIGNEASNISFESMSSSLSALESRFSSLGIVGMRVIENLTDTMMSFANSVTSFVTSKVISGGITRAMNLENAQFQLEGLLNDEEKVAAVMQNVNDAVDGTAYSLDAAANVASQLAASGIEAGDGMFTSLRAVAGVAAMTNSSYEDIGRVFTTVAGQGKVMADQLNQLASRGMNAAATLGNYLGVTEAEVRTMVSEGEVSFETFAAAMDDAFGEHAKAANETFTGSISNVGAALARIGAKFVSPLVAKGGDMVEMFNAIRVKINEVNASMDPVANTFTTTVNIIARLVKHYAEVVNFADSLEILTNVVQGLDRRLKFIRVAFYNVFDPFESAKEGATGVTAAILALSKAFNKFSKATKTTYIEETEKIFSALNIILTDLSNVLGTVLQGFGHASRKLQQMNTISITLGDVLLAVANAFHTLVSAIDNGKMDQTNTTYKLATDVFIVLTRVLETLKTVFSQVVNVAKLVGEAFVEVFDIKDGAETIRYAARMVRNFAQSLTLSDEDSQNLKDTFKGLFSIIKIVADVFKSLVSAIWPATDGISSLNSGILKITGAIGRFITGIADADTRTKTITGVFSSLLNVLKSIPGYLSKVVSKFADFIKNASGINMGSIFSSIGSFFENLGSNIASINFSGAFGTIIQSITNFVSNIFSALSSLGTKKSDGPDKMVSNLEKIVSPLNKVWETVKSIFSGISEAASSFWSAISPIFSKVGELLTTVFSGIAGIITNFISAISSASSSFSPILSSIANAFISFIDALSSVFDFIKTIFSGLSTLFSDLFAGLKPLASSISGAIQSIFDTIAEHPATSISGGFFAALLAIIKDLTASLKNTSDIGSGLASLYKGIGSFMTSLGNSIKQWKKDTIPDTMIKIAEALIIIAAALWIIASIPEDKISSSVDAVILSLGALFGMIMGLEQYQKQSKNIGDTLDLSVITSAIEKVSIAMLLLALALKSLSGVDPVTLAEGGGLIAGLIAEILGMFILMAKTMKKGIDLAIMNAIPKTVLSLAVAIKLMVKPIKTLGEMALGDLIKGGVAVGAIFAAIVAFIYFMTKFKPDPEMLKMIAAAMVSLSVAVNKLAKVVLKLGGEDFKSVQEGMLGLLEIAVIMVAVIAVLSKLTAEGFKAENFEAAVVGMIGVAAAMDAILPIIIALAIMDFDTMEKAIIGFLAVVAVMTLALLAIANIAEDVKPDTLLSSVAAMYILALALDTLIPILTFFAAMKPKNILKMVVALAALLAIFAVFGLAATQIEDLGIALALLAASFTIFAIGVVLISEGFSKITLTMIALATAWPMVSKVFDDMVAKIGASIPVLVSGFVDGLVVLAESLIDAIPVFIDLLDAFIVGLIDLCVGYIPEVVKYILDFIVQILDAIVENGEQIAKDLIEVLIILVDFLVAASYELGVLVAGVIIEFICGVFDEIGNRAEEFFESFFNMVINILDGLATAIDNASESDFIDSLNGVISSIISAIVSGFKSVWTRIRNLGRRLISWIVSGLEDRAENIWDTVSDAIGAVIDGAAALWDRIVEIGHNIVDGIVQGIRDFIDDPAGTISEVAGNLLDTFTSYLGIASPSKVMRKMGGYICQGLSIGIDKGTDGVVDSSKDLASATYEAISAPMSSLADLLGSDFDIDPTIRPVLDLESIQEGAQQIGGLLNQQTLDLATTNSQLSASREASKSAKSSQTSDLNSNVKALTDAIQNGNFGIPDDAQIIVYSVLDGKTVGTTVAPFVDSINGTTYTKAKRGYVT